MLHSEISPWKSTSKCVNQFCNVNSEFCLWSLTMLHFNPSHKDPRSSENWQISFPRQKQKSSWPFFMSDHLNVRSAATFKKCSLCLTLCNVINGEGHAVSLFIQTESAGPPWDEALLSSSPIKPRAALKYAQRESSKDRDSVVPQCQTGCMCVN